jgi:hypothetical protein
MKAFLNRAALLCFCTVLGFGAAAAGQTPETTKPLTNTEIVKLVRAGFKEKTIVSIIAARPPAYDLSPDRMIELKRSGVSEKIILAMLARQEGGDLADETWTDEPFFQENNNKPKENQKSGADDSSNIFGSNSGAQSKTRTRGGTSSASGDTETLGSATVRIIRPPSEAGAPLKLEKLATLNNDSIVELVEAGFSDGTIVRRIEQSPVDFDLSAAKIAELRKHRISEKVLAAMTTAMGDDANPRKSGPLSNGTPKPE